MRLGRLLPRAASLALCAALVASCATIPTGSPPHALGPVQRAMGAQDTMAVPEPAPGMAPETLIRDFLKASVDPADRHGKARKFLTEEASRGWDDGSGGAVIDTIDVLVPEEQNEHQSDRMRFQIRALAVGHIEPDGVVGRDDTAVDRQIEVTRVRGEWRISSLDKGVLVDAKQFQYRYQRRNLYFLNPSGAQLVPDPRWVCGDQTAMAEQLVRSLIKGPRPVLANAVRTQIPQRAALRSPVARVSALPGNPNARGLSVDFTGLGELSQKDKQLLAAQVVWTLAAAGVTGPYALSADGSPLEERLASGWTVNDVAAWDPNAESAGNSMYAVSGGTLARVTDRGVQRVAGALGVVNSILAAAVNQQETFAAAVVKGPDGSAQLMVGPPDKTVNLGAAAEHTMTRPTWTPDGSKVWTVLDGSTVASVSVDPNGQLSRSEVDVSELGRAPQDGPITELRLSPDGVRAALVVSGRLITMNVRQNENGVYTLTDAQSLLTSTPDHPVQVTSVDWGVGDVLYVAQAPAVPTALQSPVLEVPIGSPFSVTVPSRNLTPPISSITASATTMYVTDSRAVLQLRKNSGAEDFWKEIPMLHGTLSTIVLPK
ncbi:Lipoprotein LpqB, beta-propeller domain-like protein [Segniliparus rotundus DSM 44985]|uniref:Lipoprotein LpqB n=1 Tax=Segniliparus rotundus (strain ATCC BAA-972 / CDC 1076 / CIP 108378 / DSM 44985 / JCM 13578) TaxID=640132 RepID=D6Z9Z2_SEGRD|nr:MtrAB system accessory lipoprotein LpqB [Segniliparus rotundus]ADG98662.1 Lipoprotein LpqB, beta-propeller domain-like protein [Segniliparus rotundus DSM 44985]